MAETLVARSTPACQPRTTVPNAGRHAEVMGWRPCDTIGELLRLRDDRQVAGNPILLTERAFHTTNDFPLLHSAAANKMRRT